MILADPKMDTNFVQADDSNLPKIDAFMIAQFFKNNTNFCAPELKNVKMTM